MPVKTILCILYLLLACSGPVDKTPVSEMIESGNVKISVTPSSSSFRTCDLLEISIEITYPQDYKIKLPDSKSNYGDFLVYQINQNSPVSINEHQNRIYQIIILEPGLPAKHALPPMKFTFWDGQNKEMSVETAARTFDVLSSIDSAKNKDIEDIIIKTDKSSHTVTLIGSGALFLTLFYFIFICKPEETAKTNPAAEALEKFKDLKALNEQELIKELPKAACSFLRAKFQINSPANNIDVFIKEISAQSSLKNIAGKLSTLLSEYNKLRFGSAQLDSENIKSLHCSFETLFMEIQK